MPIATGETSSTEPPLAGPQGDAASIPRRPSGGPVERFDYHATGGRRFAFSFIFLLLLPFYASLGPMIGMRIVHGYWTGTFGLMLLAAAFTVVIYLVFAETLSSIRSRIVLGAKGAFVRVPKGRGVLSQLQFETHAFSYSDVEAVEIRREIYGGAIAPMMMKGARVVKKDGTLVRLGYVNEANEDPAFPYVEIAERIAHRAGVPMIDAGSVRRSARNKILGIRAGGPREQHDVSDEEMAELNRAHTRLIVVLVAVLVTLVVFGMVGDIMDGL